MITLRDLTMMYIQSYNKISWRKADLVTQEMRCGLKQLQRSPAIESSVSMDTVESAGPQLLQAHRLRFLVQGSFYL